MYNLKIVKTPNGGTVEIIFEDNSVKELFEKEVSQKEVEREISKIPKEIDTGKGTVIRFLVNNEGIVVLIIEKDYAKWEKEKNWFHYPIHVVKLSTLLDVLSNVNFKESSQNCFSGPTNVEYVLYTMTLEEFNIEIGLCSCDTCLERFCKDRTQSFNSEEMERVIETSSQIK